MSQRNLKDTSIEGEQVILRLGCSRDKRDFFVKLCKRFNCFQFRLNPNQQRLIAVEVVSQDNHELVESALRGDFEVICPDSTVWVEQIESTSLEELTIFAVSPLVIAMRPFIAQRLGYPNRPIGWSDILTEAQENSEFQWSHPHIQSTAGLLTAFAEFHVAAGMPEELSQDHIYNERVLSYVQNLEQRVQQYGPSEMEIISHAFCEGEWQIDAFVAQERLVLSSFKEVSEQNRPVIIYPKEGAAWIDHPLVLLSHEGVSEETRTVYQRLRDYFLSADAQSLLTQEGFRTVGPHIKSYFSQPVISSRLLQKSYTSSVPVFRMPSAYTLKSIVSNWYSTKRRAAVYLLVDISGSMAGDKLEEAKKGLLAFLDQFGSFDDAVGLITFESIVKEVVPLGSLSRNLGRLKSEIASLTERNMTALLDAIDMAYDLLQNPYNDDPIRAIVVMTDGLENHSSSIDREQLKTKIINGNRGQFPVAIFGLAYGGDADLDLLNHFSVLTKASAMVGDLTNIQTVYKRLSTFV